ncbi:MAG TPA: PIG-L deacetylase family protein, partial [Anaerolineaceae bacterium]|nr:PIG-L deacetylase family protein [Anaerolineaceae bacterium]
MTTLFPEGWTEPKQILVILAHPDDPEFFCGASIARWTHAGHQVTYCLLTNGNKGAKNRTITPDELTAVRQKEQCAAAAVLGVRDVRFLNHEDGYLVPDLQIRREIVRVIREVKPSIVVTSDPTNYFPGDVRLNHPDHRAAGEAALSAVYPGAGNHLYFPDLLEAGLDTVDVREVWVTLTHQPTVTIDVTEYWGLKLEALHRHESQIRDQRALDERILGRFTPDSSVN